MLWVLKKSITQATDILKKKNKKEQNKIMASMEINMTKSFNPPSWDKYNASECEMRPRIRFERKDDAPADAVLSNAEAIQMAQEFMSGGGLEAMKKINSFEPTFAREYARTLGEDPMFPPEILEWKSPYGVEGQNIFQYAWERTLNKLRIVQQLTTKNTDHSGHNLSRRQSSIKGADCLGIFAEKDYKKGDIITQYAIHTIMFVNQSQKIRIEYDKSIFSDQAFLGKKLNPNYSKMIEDNNASDYVASVRSEDGPENEPIDITVSITGFPNPELNKDERFWGHLINDKAYELGGNSSDYDNMKYKNNCCLGWAGQDCEELWKELNEVHMINEFEKRLDSGKVLNERDINIARWECTAEHLGRMNDRISVVATKNISKGTELGTSYGEGYWYGTGNKGGLSRHTRICYDLDKNNRQMTSRPRY